MCTKNPGPKKKGGHKITWIRRFPIRQVWQGRRILLKSLARACCVWKIERSPSFSKSSHLCFESQAAVYCVLCAALNCCPGKRPNWTSGLASPTYGTVWSRLWKGGHGYDRLLVTYDHLHDHVIMNISTNPTWAPPRRSPLLREPQTQFFSLHDHARSSSDHELVCKETLKMVDSLWL